MRGKEMRGKEVRGEGNNDNQSIKKTSIQGNIGWKKKKIVVSSFH